MDISVVLTLHPIRKSETRHDRKPLTGHYPRISRRSLNARTAATTHATTLAQGGMETPLIKTSHPIATRSNWTNATSENTTTAAVVKGFMHDSYS
jgi:hypothetical protein